jgi:hypothetical protein
MKRIPLVAIVMAFLASVFERAFLHLTQHMARTGLLLTASGLSTELTIQAGPAYGNNPTTKVKANKMHGRIRIFEASFTVPAAAGPGIGEKIYWGQLPLGARVMGHLSRMRWSAGAASSTLNLGDGASAARHLAATAVTAAGSATPDVAETNGASFETSDATANAANSWTSATDNCVLISTVAGAALAAGQVITLRVPYTLD